MEELLHQISVEITRDRTKELRISKIELEYAYDQMKLSKETRIKTKLLQVKDGTSEKSPKPLTKPADFTREKTPTPGPSDKWTKRAQKGGNVIRCNTEPNLSSDKCQSNLDLPLDFHRTNEIYVYTYL